MFRTLVILGVLAVCAFMAGWFTIQRDENETTIRFNREEIRADTSKAIAKGRELLESGQDQLAEEDGLFPQQATRPTPPWEQPFFDDASTAPRQY
ncbi:hypothetical protein Mal15_38000 [Stieleria maiorica]|uniref:Uncharacterized protein n=1 Tax=Stieleria maiorica TaxID=2795974 RepID=A0A5B9MJB6_9BACT|nr:hypothetical protein [Stieleria maiorica]QEF99734.1 hypothetical protein Mal15_38000 [Stieleria maiorica]